MPGRDAHDPNEGAFLFDAFFEQKGALAFKS